MLVNLIAKLHPLVVHFPIALLVTALLLAVWSRVRGGPIKHALRPLLVLGAASALLAVITGWLLAEEGQFFGAAAQHLLLHRWIGIGAAGVAVLLAMFLDEKRSPGTLALVGLVVGAAAVGVTGHFGGVLVFGEDHWVLDEVTHKRAKRLTDPPGPKRVGRPDPVHAVEPAAAVVDAAPDAPSGAAPTAKPPETVRYAQIQPLFKRSCLRCHDARKRKGDLRLDEKGFAMAGGESGVVIKPGDAKGSLLFKMISLPKDHEDYMPSKGDPLTDDEIALIGRWIDQGADWPE